ncbi:MAG: hypothetical protein CM15mP116_08450 [Synechococcus sp.]|nr:MAG: hypothetical protein CM15mP116_08450 [Synechococcus sp.]
MFRRTDMQTLSAETLQGLLKNLYPEDSSVDAALLSSQLLQILLGASANDDDAGRLISGRCRCGADHLRRHGG